MSQVCADQSGAGRAAPGQQREAGRGERQGESGQPVLVSYQTPLKSLVIYEFSVFPFVCPGQLGSELSVCIGVVKIPT